MPIPLSKPAEGMPSAVPTDSIAQFIPFPARGLDAKGIHEISVEHLCVAGAGLGGCRTVHRAG
jgi:hypothetical protein